MEHPKSSKKSKPQIEEHFLETPNNRSWVQLEIRDVEQLANRQ